MPPKWPRITYVFAALGMLALVAVSARIGRPSHPWVFDESVSVAELKKLATQAEHYRQDHPSVGYPTEIRDFYSINDDSLKFQCGKIVDRANEVCSIRSKSLPAEYLFSYKVHKSVNS